MKTGSNVKEDFEFPTFCARKVANLHRPSTREQNKPRQCCGREKLERSHRLSRRQWEQEHIQDGERF